MIRLARLTRRRLAVIATVLLLAGTAFLPRRGIVQGDGKKAAGKFTEELALARSEDSITNGGAIFSPPKDAAKSIVVVWVHGAGVNFLYPTYVKIGSSLAKRGYTCVTVNLRTHDVGTIAGWREGKPIRGGGLWALPRETVHDIAAWIDFVQERGFKQVMLVGHSASAAAVRAYQALKQDGRVVGLVFASGEVRPAKEPLDRESGSSMACRDGNVRWMPYFVSIEAHYRARPTIDFLPGIGRSADQGAAPAHVSRVGIAASRVARRRLNGSPSSGACATEPDFPVSRSSRFSSGLMPTTRAPASGAIAILVPSSPIHARSGVTWTGR